MAKILITGMTASQYGTADKRTKTFAGQMRKLLAEQNHTVEHVQPDISWTRDTLAHYDVVLIGLAPILGMGSAHSYGALHMIYLLQDDPRLRLFIDAPVPTNVGASLRSVLKNPDQLTKPFHAKRPNFHWASSGGRDSLLDAVSGLVHGNTAPILYPMLPWAQDDTDWHLQMPDAMFGNFIGLNLDGADSITVNKPEVKLLEYWATDNVRSKWVENITRRLSFGVGPMKTEKFSKDEDVSRRMSWMVGSLIAPQRDGRTWWTPRYLQSLAVGTPVATEWRESFQIGSSWSVLPQTIEDMSVAQRIHLAREQAEAYLACVPVWELASYTLESAVGIDYSGV